MKPEQRAMLTEYRTGYGVRTESELRKLAHRLATTLGHLPIRQGTSVECAKCGASGTAHEILAGAVHLMGCV